MATATVSNVLTGRRQVAEDRRRRVLEAVGALGYQPNRLAAGLRRQRTGTVGMVVPDLTNPFFAALVQRVEELAAEGDCQILLVDSSNDPAREAARTRALLAHLPRTAVSIEVARRVRARVPLARTPTRVSVEIRSALAVELGP